VDYRPGRVDINVGDDARAFLGEKLGGSLSDPACGAAGSGSPMPTYAG